MNRPKRREIILFITYLFHGYPTNCYIIDWICGDDGSYNKLRSKDCNRHLHNLFRISKIIIIVAHDLLTQTQSLHPLHRIVS